LYSYLFECVLFSASDVLVRAGSDEAIENTHGMLQHFVDCRLRGSLAYGKDEVMKVVGALILTIHLNSNKL